MTMAGERCRSVILTSIFFLYLHVIVVSGSEKKGVCPYLPPPTYCRDNYNLCNSDGDCPLSNFKCCSNGCKKICAGSVPRRSATPSSAPPERSRPGNCPPLPVQKYCIAEVRGCSNDFDCRDQFKCCSNGCVKRCFLATTRKAIESGNRQQRNATCPHFPTNNTNCPARSTDQCKSDANCLDQGRSFKCCWDGCRKICLNPSEVQQTEGRSLCPDLRGQSRCTNFRQECISDSECRDGNICCSDGCNMKCVRPKAVASATASTDDRTAPAAKKFRLDDKCPFIPRPSRCPTGALHQCYSNQECPQTLMCCSDGCRNICFDITKDISLLTCPIARRPERCPENSPNFCTSNNDCERGQKCCYDGCDYRCFGRNGFIKSISESPVIIKPMLSAAEVVFVMDTSDGPTLEEFELQKSFATSLSRYFELGPNKVRIAIVTSDRDTNIVKYLTPSVTQADFESYMVRLYKQGGNRELNLVFEVIERDVLSEARPRLPQIVIIFSFGLPSSSVWSLLTSVRSLHSSGVNVFAIGIDVEHDEAQLRALVYRPTDLFTFYSARQLEHMGGIFASHVVSRADPDAVPENFSADLIFLLDSSVSVGRTNFTKVKNFVLSLSRLLNFEPKKTRVSLITFGDVVAEISARFGRYNSITNLRNAMNWIAYLGGHARIERALEKTEQLLGNSRPGVRKVAVMVTDDNYLAGEDQPLQQTMLPMRKKGLEMVTLVVGGSQDDTRRLASLTERPTDIFTTPNYDELSNVVPAIAKYIAHGPPPTTVRPTTTSQPTRGQSTTTAQPKTLNLTPIPRQLTTHSILIDTKTSTRSFTKLPTTATRGKHTTNRKYVAAGKIPTEGITIKPGKCPRITRRSGCQNPQRYCFTDSDCNANGKCCSDGCTISCVEPVTNINIQNAPSRESSKAGICPMVSRIGIPCPSQDQCKKDNDCAGKKKCCMHICRRLVCVDPPSRVEERRLTNQLYRSGKCPILQKPDTCQPITKIECNYDVDCPQPKKCCSDGCHRRCVDAAGRPVPTAGGGGTETPNRGTRPGFAKKGQCPPYSPVKICPPLVQDACTCTSDCATGLKCCFDGCKRICRKPAGNECAAQVDIVYLMDTSGSISSDDYRLEKQFVKDLARIFRIDVDASHAAAIIYNDDPHVMIKLGDHRSTDDFAKAVDAIPYLHGRTRIDKALKASTEAFRNARTTVRKVLVVLTDGRQTQDPDSVPLDKASKPLKDMGVQIYAVGVGHKIDLKELTQIAQNNTDNVFTVDSFTELIGESQTIAERACGDVSGKICVQGVDLGFIVDSSESILDVDFEREKNAIKAISDEFIIAPQSTRAGVVLYSGEPHISIHFNQHASNSMFNRAVDALPHMQSHTRLDKALRYAASNLYNERRPGNPAIAIVMTDGKQTPGAESLTTAVQPLRDLGVRVFAVGVGPRVSLLELRELVERREDIYTVDSFSQLIEEAKKVTEKACPAPSETIPPPLTIPTSTSTKAATTEAATTEAASTKDATTPSSVPSLIPSPSPIQCSHFLDIIFVMDSSRSMDLREYDRQKVFIKRLAKIFNVGEGSRAAVIIYSDDPVLSIDFEKYNTQKDFLEGVDKLPYIMLRTRIDKALVMASQVLLDSRPGFPKAVIIMTDGRQTRDPGYTPLEKAAEPLHNAGARVLVVGIGPQISATELESMVREPSDVFPVKSFDSLVHAASDVAIKSCTGPFPSIVPSICAETFDLAFAMDSSGSMLISSYTKEKEFIKHVARQLVVGPRQVMLGLLVFSDQPRVLVRFGSQASVSLSSFDAAVDNAPYMRGRTRIDRALQEAFSLFNGGRPDVPKVLVFLTDGRQSSDPGVTPLEVAVKPLIAQNVKIIVVGIGQEIDRQQLTILANGQGRHITQIGSFDDLDKLKTSFSQTICRRVEEVIQSGPS